MIWNCETWEKNADEAADEESTLQKCHPPLKRLSDYKGLEHEPTPSDSAGAFEIY